MTDGKEFATEIVKMIKAAIARETAPLRDRIAALERAQGPTDKRIESLSDRVRDMG